MTCHTFIPFRVRFKCSGTSMKHASSCSDSYYSSYKSFPLSLEVNKITTTKTACHVTMKKQCVNSSVY